jgi:ubiquinone/menaquinone biosynthesis C-methylase UbiE
MTTNRKRTSSADPRSLAPDPCIEGWHGWDEYAPFYDWENAQTMGRRDVKFWQDLAARLGGPALELGCGTGRVTLPVARSGVALVGIDRSEQMLACARRRVRRACLSRRPALVRGDIRSLPFGPRTFSLVMAPYGILQSLLADGDLDATLASTARVLAPGGTLGIDLVADLPSWQEYWKRVRLHGRRGSAGPQVTLIESVRQEPDRKLTIFEQEYVEHRGTRSRRRQFSLAFRTLSVPEMTARVEAAGFRMAALLGDYESRPWDPRAEVWIILASKK